MKRFAVAVVATFNRPRELTRLLFSLQNHQDQLGSVVVVDNGGDDEIHRIASQAGCNVRYVSPGRNLGCGGGIRVGCELALREFDAELTHIWILDDDTVVRPNVLRVLIEEMELENADAACPMVVDSQGRIGWLPGLADAKKLKLARQCGSPEEFLARGGSAPIPLLWSQGISLLVSRRAINELGLHRPDFWVRGEDLEFSLRITARFKGIFIPKVSVQHIPPEADEHDAGEGNYFKHCAMLQNISYISLHLHHGRRIAWTLPANCRRFFGEWGISSRTLAHGVYALWLGGVAGKPAGDSGGDHFRRCMDAQATRSHDGSPPAR